MIDHSSGSRARGGITLETLPDLACLSWCVGELAPVERSQYSHSTQQAISRTQLTTSTRLTGTRRDLGQSVHSALDVACPGGGRPASVTQMDVEQNRPFIGAEAWAATPTAIAEMLC
ncbi:hypothetical protein [Bosea sp. (in: a-proteobacteria)]